MNQPNRLPGINCNKFCQENCRRKTMASSRTKMKIKAIVNWPIGIAKSELLDVVLNRKPMEKPHKSIDEPTEQATRN
ncbi:hypothetical protein WP50_04410 [Lactiplantibacillus plantarum]|nr:hypothetical protein WP50_04410 [Lactiplantibacillus plantarum]